MSKEKFPEILKNIGFSSIGFQEEVSGWKLVKEVSLKLSEGIFQNLLKEIAFEFPKDSENPLHNIPLSDISDDVFNEIVKEDPQGLYHKMVKIKNDQRKILFKSPFVIFEHCFGEDILNNTVSPGKNS